MLKKKEMPFESKQQMKACWRKYHEDIRAGRVPAWDCHKWYHEGGGREAWENLPKWKNRNLTKTSSKKNSSSGKNSSKSSGKKEKRRTTRSTNRQKKPTRKKVTRKKVTIKKRHQKTIKKTAGLTRKPTPKHRTRSFTDYLRRRR